MIDIDIKLSGDLERGLEKFEEKMKGEVLISAAAAMARPVYEELLLNTSPPRIGRVTGNLNAAVYRTLSESRSDEDTKAYHVGINKSKAPHWHFLEYGTSKMAARAPIRRAHDTKIQEAIKAGMERLREKVDG